MSDKRIEKMKKEFGIKSCITQKTLCEHIEEDDFFEKFPGPVLVEGEDDRRLVLIQWSQYQRFLRHMEVARRMLRPGYDPEKMVTLKISVEEELFNQVELICAQRGMTVAGAIEEFLHWSVEYPEELAKMVDEARRTGLLDECRNSPQVAVEWLDAGADS